MLMESWKVFERLWNNLTYKFAPTATRLISLAIPEKPSSQDDKLLCQLSSQLRNHKNVGNRTICGFQNYVCNKSSKEFKIAHFSQVIESYSQLSDLSLQACDLFWFHCSSNNLMLSPPHSLTNPCVHEPLLSDSIEFPPPLRRVLYAYIYSCAQTKNTRRSRASYNKDVCLFLLHFGYTCTTGLPYHLLGILNHI